MVPQLHAAAALTTAAKPNRLPLQAVATLLVAGDFVVLASVLQYRLTARQRLAAPAAHAGPSSWAPAQPVSLVGTRSAPQPAPRPQPEGAPQPGAAAKPARLRVPAADGLRGLAALMVILFHVIYAAGLPVVGSKGLRDFIASGFIGVDFFFVLSGFVLFLPIVTSGGVFRNKGAYALRRVARILPAYYLAVAATVWLHPFFSKTYAYVPGNSRQGWYSLIFHATFLQHSVGLAVGYPEGFGVNGAVWTLSIEALFYLVLPLIAVWYFRRPFIGLFAALAASTAWKVATMHNAIPMPHAAGIPTAKFAKVILITQFPTYLAHFAAGMTAAWVFVKLRRRWTEGHLLAIPVALASLVAVIYGTEWFGRRDVAHVAGTLDHWNLTTPVALAFAVLLLATALSPRWAQFPFTNPVIKWLGDISYGMYLYHLLFLWYALTTLHYSQVSRPESFVRLAEFTVGGAVVAATISHYLIERPFVQLARRFSERRVASRRVAAAPMPAPAPVPGHALPMPAPLASTVPVSLPRPARAHAASTSAVRVGGGARQGNLSFPFMSAMWAPAANGHASGAAAHANGHGNGNGHGLHLNGHANGNGPGLHLNGNGHASGNGHGLHLNGNGHANGAGHGLHLNGNGNGHAPALTNEEVLRQLEEDLVGTTG